MKDPISDVDRPLDRPQRYLVPHPATWRNYQTCPWATSIIAIDPETEGLVLCPLTCKRWGCAYCAPRKIRKLAFLTNGASPNRWIRLAVNPRNYDSPREAWEHTSPKVPELARRLAKTLSTEIEYLRVTELHQSGFPHYHALLRSGFIPEKILNREWALLTQLPHPKKGEEQLAVFDARKRGHNMDIFEAKLADDRASSKSLKTLWAEATGCPFNWIAKIDSTFSSFRYLVKYLTKLHKIEWTDRHVSYSRNFFRAEDREKLAFPERTITSRSDEHPWVYLSRRYTETEVGVDGNGCYHLPYDFFGEPHQISRADVGLPYLPETAEPRPPKQVQRTAFETSPAPDYSEVSF